MSKSTSERRAYKPGEDRQFHGIVCQGITSRHGRGFEVCGERAVVKEGRYKLTGGWHDVYTCPRGHRFGVMSSPTGHKSVIDIPTRKPTFGDHLGF